MNQFIYQKPLAKFTVEWSITLDGSQSWFLSSLLVIVIHPRLTKIRVFTIFDIAAFSCFPLIVTTFCCIVLNYGLSISV